MGNPCEQPKKIYIVCATCGQYSDRTEWLVCAYFDKQAADDHALEAEKFDRAAQRTLRENGYKYPPDQQRNPWDEISPGFEEIDYSVQEIELCQGSALPRTLVEAVLNSVEEGDA